MLKLILAAFVPYMLVLFFDRVTYNHYVATSLTAALLVASYFAGYMDSVYIAILDVASLVAGFVVAKKLREQKRRNRR